MFMLKSVNESSNTNHVICLNISWLKHKFNLSATPKIKIWQQTGILFLKNVQNRVKDKVFHFFGCNCSFFTELKTLYSLWYFPVAKSWIDLPDWRGKLVYTSGLSPFFSLSSSWSFHLNLSLIHVYMQRFFWLWYSMIQMECNKVNSYISALKPLPRLPNSSKWP